MTAANPSLSTHSSSAGTVAARARDGLPPPSVNSDQLLGKHHAVTIRHQGAEYVLRATRKGKLILTK